MQEGVELVGCEAYNKGLEKIDPRATVVHVGRKREEFADVYLLPAFLYFT